MSGRQTIDYDPVEALLDQGRRELAGGEPEKARWCFEEVLRRRPDDPRALLGLSYVGRKSDSPGADGASILQADVEVVKLVKDKRYEEALDLLRREALARPGDAAIERSIAHLERHIERTSGVPPARDDEPTRLDSPGEGVAIAPTVSIAPKSSDEERVERTTPDAGGSPEPDSAAVRIDGPIDAHGERLPADGTSDPHDVVEHGKGEDIDPSIDPNELDVHQLVPRDLASSGGIRLADEDPSGAALGSLPPAPAEKSEAGWLLWGLLLLLVVASLAVFFATYS